MTPTRFACVLSCALALPLGVKAELQEPLRRMVAEMPAPAEGRQALATALAAAAGAGVASEDLQAILKQAVTYRYAAADVAPLVDSLAATRRDGLPLGLVRDKVLEGMAKQIPGGVIRDVSLQWSGALRSARLSLRGLEERGLKYGSAGEQDALTNLGARFTQRYQASAALSSLAGAGMAGGKLATGAFNLLAAGAFAELLLVHGATVEQALEIPQAALRNGSSPEQIRALQRKAVDLLRQGIAPVDLIVTMRRGPAAADSLMPRTMPSQPLPGQFGGPGTPGAQPAFPAAMSVPGAVGGTPGAPGAAGPQGFPGGAYGPPGGAPFPRQ